MPHVMHPPCAGASLLPGLLTAVVPHSRRSASDAIDAARALMRQRLLRAIEADPGATPSRLVQRLGLGWSTLYFHLEALEASGLVRRVRHGRHCFVFPEGIAGDLDRSAERAALEGEKVRLLAAEILRNPGHGIASLAAATGVAPRVVYHHVRRLRRQGLVTSSREHRYADLAPSERLRELLRDEEGAA